MKARQRFLASLFLLGVASAASALDYRSVDVPAAILYDAPSQKGKKLYLIKAQTPVEVVVRLDGWLKVRDAEGTLAWIESKAVSEKRHVVVTAPRAVIRKEAKDDAVVAFEADKWVALELVEAGPSGWVHVRHRDGASGFVKATQVWGL